MFSELFNFTFYSHSNLVDMGRSSRSRSRNKRKRAERSRSRCSRGRRSRSTSRHGRKRQRDSSRQERSKSRDLSLQRVYCRSLETIVSRLTALEHRSRQVETPSVSNAEVSSGQYTERIVEAIQSLKSVNSQSYYISNFDPNFNDVSVWFDEVDKAQILNKWSDSECLSRIGNCLKGDARVWLNEWVTDDRSWSNFKRDFRSLCVRKIDVANVLYEVMSTDSDSFVTYAEYARRSLLRLRVVRGLSEELTTAIVIRGIKDPIVKASAANSNLTPENIVSHLSTFVKPKTKLVSNQTRPTFSNKEHPKSFIRHQNKTGPKCFICGRIGHRQLECRERFKPSTSSAQLPGPSTTCDKKPFTNITCAYCKKVGHEISNCFAKQRSYARNTSNVNFCSTPKVNQNDVVVGIIQGVPIDILIDSGALGVSLISSSVINYFSCHKKFINRRLKGISDSVIYVNSYVTLTIELEEISLEADLLIVPDECMNAPIIIGTDVLNREGITYVRTRDSQRITHNIASINVSPVEPDMQLDDIKTSISGEDLKNLTSILRGYSQFMITGTAMTTVTTGKMHIRLNSNATVNYRPYKMSFNEKLKVRVIIQDLLAKGIIRESESPYSSPVLLVKKKDGSDRMCVDFRALNRLTVKDRYPLPLIDDHLDRLGKARFFTTLDMATGFHQINLDEESIPLTGFVTPEGHYEYIKMPYGLANAPIVYQRIISNTLREFIETGNVVVYIDDCLILSYSIAEGMQTLKEVLDKLTKSGFSINLKKCSFLCKEIEYLGRVISNGNVKPAVGKIQALINSPVPQNVRQVRQFLGLAGYFRKYIAGYSTKTSCIARLTKKGIEFSWGQEQENVRQELIKCLTSEPVLAIFDPELPIEIHTDASSTGYGAVLLQIHKDSSKRVVAYYSQVTQGAEPRYHSYELETLAVVKSLKHFRHYLVGTPFTVVTDCNALKATQSKKDLLPRIARWWMYLQDFDFNIQYRKGIMLPHADYLSRNPIHFVNNISRPQNWAQVAQSADEETQKLIRLLDEGQLDATRYVKRNDILYYRYTPVGEPPRLLCFIPKGHRLSLLRIFHDEHCHCGADKTADLVLRHFWFPSLKAFISKYISHCLTCIAHKRIPRAPLQPITSWPKPDIPFDTLHIDALGPLPASQGFKHILIVVDSFTKYCLLYAIRRQDVDQLKSVIQNVISLFGTPRIIICDRARMFESRQFVTLMNELGCQLHYITPEMHQANGQVERYVRTVLNMLRIEVDYKKNEWADELWRLQLILNITKQKTTQFSPLNLLVGSESATPAIRALIRDVAVESTENRESLREIRRQRTAERLAQNQSEQDKRVNEDRHPPRIYKEDDLVFVIKYSQSQGKLDPGMRGPYRVTQVLENGRYKLQLLAGAYGKVTYAAAQFLVPWKGEWTPETCASFFEGES